MKSRHPMPPKVNHKRALFVLSKVDEILPWEIQKETERALASSTLAAIGHTEAM
jgi:hypothetical protein